MNESIVSAVLLNKSWSEVVALHKHMTVNGFVTLTLPWLVDCRASQKGIVWAVVMSSDLWPKVVGDKYLACAVDPTIDHHRLTQLGHMGSILGLQIYTDGYASPELGNRLPPRTVLVVSTEETFLYNVTT